MRHAQTESPEASPGPTLAIKAARIEQMLAEAPLVTVVEAAAENGINIVSRTALRWSIHGRQGQRLTTVRVRGRLCTTVPELRRWLAATAVRQQESRRAKAAGPSLDPDAADQVLGAHGLGREGVGLQQPVATSGAPGRAGS